MSQLAEVDQLGDGVRKLVTRRVATRVPMIVTARVAVDCVDHLLEEMDHLSARKTDCLSLLYRTVNSIESQGETPASIPICWYRARQSIETNPIELSDNYGQSSKAAR